MSTYEWIKRYRIASFTSDVVCVSSQCCRCSLGGAGACFYFMGVPNIEYNAITTRANQRPARDPVVQGAYKVKGRISIMINNFYLLIYLQHFNAPKINQI